MWTNIFGNLDKYKWNHAVQMCFVDDQRADWWGDALLQRGGEVVTSDCFSGWLLWPSGFLDQNGGSQIPLLKMYITFGNEHLKVGQAKAKMVFLTKIFR